VTTDPRDAVTRLLAIGVVQRELAEEERRLRKTIPDLLPVGDRLSGRLFAGAAPIGTVTMAEGSEVVKITDDAAFFSWVLENYPEQIEQVPRVRPAFQSRVLAAVKAEGCYPNAATGEADKVPGVVVEKGDPKPMVKPLPAARSAVLEWIRSGAGHIVEAIK
jgi:hypothetical protein